MAVKLNYDPAQYDKAYNSFGARDRGKPHDGSRKGSHFQGCLSGTKQYIESLGSVESLEEKDLKPILDQIYKFRNMLRTALSGVQLDDDQLTRVEDEKLFDESEKLPVAHELILSIAERLFNSSKAKKGDTIVVAGSKRDSQVILEVAKLCFKNGVNFTLDVEPDALNHMIMNNANDEGLSELANEKTRLYEGVGIQIVARSNPADKYAIGSKVSTKFGNLTQSLRTRRQKGDLQYALTIIPTPEDAEKDGIPYEEYMEMFFEACNQAWEEIKEDQKVLVEKLNKGNKLKITSDDGTDLDIDITGQTFANSVVLKNIPGAEVFSSPLKEGVNGKLVAKGKFKFKTYPMIEDITLKIVKGRIVDWDARVGRETLTEIITRDDGKGEGARFFGEIAFGNNPYLKHHLMNELLAEKIGGSFHITPGDPYQMDKYDGEPVNLDNGNRSASGVHFDITSMLAGRNGKVILDGMLIQDNGVWVDENGRPDEKLAVLNKGWDALPEEKRPEWYKKKFPELPAPNSNAITKQLEAYNAHDINAFCDCFTEDVHVLSDDGELMVRGIKDFKRTFENVFKKFPDSKAVITKRVVKGNVTAEIEMCTRKNGGGEDTTINSLMVYTVDPESGKIKAIQAFKIEDADKVLLEMRR